MTTNDAGSALLTQPYPPLPDTPACWDWEPPPLPQRNRRRVLVEWQDHRCAICATVRGSGKGRTGLFEDHDHETGDVRGLLCPRCNTQEGRGTHPVFAHYRHRPPVAIMGLLLRRGWNWGEHEHPDVRAAHTDWESALSFLVERQLECRDYTRRLATRARLRRDGLQVDDPHRPLILDMELTPLMLAARDVGLTQAEWRETLTHRRRPRSVTYHGWREESRLRDEVRHSPVHVLAKMLATPTATEGK